MLVCEKVLSTMAQRKLVLLTLITLWTITNAQFLYNYEESPAQEASPSDDYDPSLYKYNPPSAVEQHFLQSQRTAPAIREPAPIQRRYRQNVETETHHQRLVPQSTEEHYDAEPEIVSRNDEPEPEYATEPPQRPQRRRTTRRRKTTIRKTIPEEIVQPPRYYGPSVFDDIGLGQAPVGVYVPQDSLLNLLREETPQRTQPRRASYTLPHPPVADARPVQSIYEDRSQRSPFFVEPHLPQSYAVNLQPVIPYQQNQDEQFYPESPEDATIQLPQRVHRLSSQEVQLPQRVHRISSQEVQLPQRVHRPSSQEIQLPQRAHRPSSQEIQLPQPVHRPSSQEIQLPQPVHRPSSQEIQQDVYRQHRRVGSDRSTHRPAPQVLQSPPRTRQIRQRLSNSHNVEPQIREEIPLEPVHDTRSNQVFEDDLQRSPRRRVEDAPKRRPRPQANAVTPAPRRRPSTTFKPAMLAIAELPDDTDDDGIPGQAGQDYPTLHVIPKTSFACSQQSLDGYYADLETACQVVHLCHSAGVQSSFLCPNGTIFSQEKFSCQWWYKVDCQNSPRYYSINDSLYKVPGESKKK